MERRRPNLSAHPCLLALFALLPGLSGCAGDGGGHAEVAAWSLGEPTVRIGSLDDPETALTLPGDVAEAPWGEVWVVQPGDGQVRVFDLDGRPVRTVGRTGDGPGEFQRPSRIYFEEGGAWIDDARSRRLTRVGADGAYRSDVRHPTPPAPSPDLRVTWGAPLAGGRALVVTDEAFQEPEDPERAFPVLSVPLDAVGSPGGAGGGGDGGGPAPAGGPDGGDAAGPGGEGGPGGSARAMGTRRGTAARIISVSERAGQLTAVQILRRPVWTRTLWAVARDGTSVVFADRVAPERSDSATYSVTRVSSRGDTLFSTEVPYAPIRLTAAMADSMVRTPAGLEGDVSELVESLGFPDHLPPVTDLVAGRDGTTWVGRERSGDTRAWDLFGPDGSHLARVAAPAGLTIHDASRDAVWGVVTDDLDVPYVVRLPVRTEPVEGNGGP